MIVGSRIGNVNVSGLYEERYALSSYISIFLATTMFIMYFLIYYFEITSPLSRQIVHIGFIIIISMVILNLRNIFSYIFTIPLVVGFSVCLLLAIILYLIFPEVFQKDLEYFGISYVSLLAGLGVSVNPKILKIMLRIYFVFSGLLTLVVLKTNIGSLEIQDQYMGFWKNGLCAMLAGQIAISTLYFLRKDENSLSKAIWLGIIILLFVGILYARGRAALLASLLVPLFIFLRSARKFSSMQLGIFVLAIPFLVVVGILLQSAFSSFLGLVSDSIFAGRDSFDLDDVSSGRWSVNIWALNLFLESPFVGSSVFSNVDMTIVHNYPLRVLSSYGLFFGISYYSMWGVLTYLSFKHLILNGLHLSNVGWVMMATLIVVSMFEHSVPFGSGTMSAVLFYILGINFNQKDNCYTRFIK